MSNHKMGRQVVLAAWLAVFCLFGYRSTFSVLLGPMRTDMGWTAAQTSLGYSLMMTVYAITAFLSGFIIDRWGTRPAYFLGAIFGGLGFFITSLASGYYSYLLSYALLAGIGTGMLWVSSTVSVRQWYTGASFARFWGLAFMGAPAAQLILSLGTGRLLVAGDWRGTMQVLALLVFTALLGAALLVVGAPETYGLKPCGHAFDDKKNHQWTLKKAFSKFAVWGAILAFLCSLVGEFLIWTQIIQYWVQDAGYSLAAATALYAVIGGAGILVMPLMGLAADRMVEQVGLETAGRKVMLIIAPLCGISACTLLLLSRFSALWAIFSTFLFTIYWAVEPGNIAGYIGAIYGSTSLGRIWGLVTLICMGIGPALGSFMGAFLFDLAGNYLYAIGFALTFFGLSTIFASLLPLHLLPKD